MKDKILIVDDQSINRELLSEILEEDYDILTAEDGIKAVQKLDTLHDEISIVLLDLQMPNLDGFGVLAAMKERHLLQRIPVLVITGNSPPSSKANASSSACPTSSTSRSNHRSCACA